MCFSIASPGCRHWEHDKIWYYKDFLLEANEKKWKKSYLPVPVGICNEAFSTAVFETS